MFRTTVSLHCTSIIGPLSKHYLGKYHNKGNIERLDTVASAMEFLPTTSLWNIRWPHTRTSNQDDDLRHRRPLHNVHHGWYGRNALLHKPDKSGHAMKSKVCFASPQKQCKTGDTVVQAPNLKNQRVWSKGPVQPILKPNQDDTSLQTSGIVKQKPRCMKQKAENGGGKAFWYSFSLFSVWLTYCESRRSNIPHMALADS